MYAYVYAYVCVCVGSNFELPYVLPNWHLDYLPDHYLQAIRPESNGTWTFTHPGPGIEQGTFL